MSDSTHHHRREHVRTNPNTGEVIPVSETLVKNTGPRTGKKFAEVADQRDGLMGLIDPDGEAVEVDTAGEMSDAERAASASLLNRLMGQDVVDSRGRPLDEYAARLLTIKNLIESLQIEMQDDGEVDDIVFALESSDWSSAGFDRKGHLPWAALGLDPEEAARWRDNGFTPFTVGAWTGSRFYGRIEPEDAKHFAKEGIGYDEARQWVYNDHAGEDAVGWIKAGGDINTANRWKRAGVGTVHEHNDWIALGVSDPNDVSILKRLGDAAANRWLDADVELGQAVRWNDVVKPGYTEKDLAPFARGEVNLTTDVVQKWQEESIPAADIEGFIQKGYTPKRALSRIKKGQNSKTAEDLRGKEPVPGKAWVELKGALNAAKSANGLKATIEESRSSDGNVLVRVFLTQPDDSPDNNAYYGRNGGRRYDFKFTNTGRFISADGTGVWRGSVRKVSDMVGTIKGY
jgi:hypothetical protein